MQFLLITLTTFAIMEAVAYYGHKYLFHGVLWSLHKSHHSPRHGAFELNDLFGLFFAPIAMTLMGGWLAPDWVAITFPIGLGMTCYGAVYLFLHDIYTHRRIVSVNYRNRWLIKMRAAHRVHHSNSSKQGQEPFGFVYFNTYRKPMPRVSSAVRGMVVLILSAALMLQVGGCAFFAEKVVEKPKVALERVSLKDVGGSGATLVFAVKVDNPNPFPINVDALRYDVEIGGKALSSGKLDKPAKVGAKESGIVELPIALRYSDVFSSVVEFLKAGTSEYRVRGEAAFGLFSVPFDQKGEVKLN